MEGRNRYKKTNGLGRRCGQKKHKRANYICEVTCSYVRYSQTSQVIKTCMRRNDTYERMVPKSKSQGAVRRGGGEAKRLKYKAIG